MSVREGKTVNTFSPISRSGRSGTQSAHLHVEYRYAGPSGANLSFDQYRAFPQLDLSSCLTPFAFATNDWSSIDTHLFLPSVLHLTSVVASATDPFAADVSATFSGGGNITVLRGSATGNHLTLSVPTTTVNGTTFIGYRLELSRVTQGASKPWAKEWNTLFGLVYAPEKPPYSVGFPALVLLQEYQSPMPQTYRPPYLGDFSLTYYPQMRVGHLSPDLLSASGAKCPAEAMFPLRPCP